MNTVIIIPQQIGDVDMDMVLTMFPVVPIHFPHFVFNKLLQMFLCRHFPQ